MEPHAEMVQHDHELAAIWPADDGTYDGLPPAGAIVDLRDDRVAFVLMLIEYAAGSHPEDDQACDLSTAINSIQEQATKRNSRRISPRHRDKLLAALVWARSAVLAWFPAPGDRTLAAKGLEATGALICMWAEPHDQIASYPAHFPADVQDHARWLRNAAHNLSLLRSIEARAAERRSATVAEIMRKAAA